MLAASCSGALIACGSSDDSGDSTGPEGAAGSNTVGADGSTTDGSSNTAEGGTGGADSSGTGGGDSGADVHTDAASDTSAEATDAAGDGAGGGSSDAAHADANDAGSDAQQSGDVVNSDAAGGDSGSNTPDGDNTSEAGDGDNGSDAAADAASEAATSSEVLATGIGADPQAVDSTYVYAPSLGSTRIFRVPIAGEPDGGDAETMTIDVSNEVGTMILVGSNVYFTDYVEDDGSMTWLLKSAPTAGGATTTLLTDPGGSLGVLAGDDTDLFFVDVSTTAALEGIPASGLPEGGAPTGILGDSAINVGVSAYLQDGYIYYPTNTGELHRVLRSGSGDAQTAETISTEGGGGFNFAVDADGVYFIASNYDLKMVPLSGGTATTIVAGANANWVGVQSGTLYWIDTTHSIRKVPTSGLPDGSAPTDVGVNLGGVSSFVVDATSVYFTNHDDGTLRKLPR
jgi:hypothetical protein